MRNRILHPGLRRRTGFSLVEIMCSLMIFAMVATAGTYLMGAMADNQEFFEGGTNSQSEVEFAVGRMVENVRAATHVGTPSSTTAGSSLSLTSIGGSTIIYSVNNGNLIEQTGATTNTLVHNVTTFSTAETAGNAKAFTITLSAGNEEPISRTFTVFGRNL